MLKNTLETGDEIAAKMTQAIIFVEEDESYHKYFKIVNVI